MTFKTKRSDKKNLRAKARNAARHEANKARVAGLEEAYGKLSVKQKLEQLDRRLGKDQGATKQRAKLQAILKEEAVKEERANLKKVKKMNAKKTE